MSCGDGYSEADEAAQYDDEAASGPEPTADRKAVYEGSGGKVHRPGYRVRVLVRDDPHAGEIGTVKRNYNDAGIWSTWCCSRSDPQLTTTTTTSPVMGRGMAQCPLDRPGHTARWYGECNRPRRRRRLLSAVGKSK